MMKLLKKLIDQAKAGTLEENPGTLIGTQLQPLGTNVNKSRNNKNYRLIWFY